MMIISRIRQKIKEMYEAVFHDEKRLQFFLTVVFLVLLATFSFGLGRLSASGMKKEPVVVHQPQNRVFLDTPAENANGNTEETFGAAALSVPTETAEVPGNTAVSQTASVSASLSAPKVKKYVASKNGTRFYLPSCSGASRINEENKVWFATEADAEASGYTPAKNCDGL
ncbi:MAG TPA: hypothetical protein VFM02_00135 [Candidatus Paceibacterota bacterium]|nr:hypothetical protein [Candidatus Paceibacterota bacterium]